MKLSNIWYSVPITTKKIKALTRNFSRIRGSACRGMYGDEQIHLPSEENYPKESVDQEVVAATILGLGMWRLRPIIHSKMATLVARTEELVRQCCIDDDLDVGSVGKFEYWDTHDPTGKKAEANPFLTVSSADPKNGELEYPRLQLENRVYTSRAFRKIQLALTNRQDDLQTFNMVIYPRTQFYLPILYVNAVINQDRVCSATVDLSSVRYDETLPDFYLDVVKQIQSHLPAQKSLPERGQFTSSPLHVKVKTADISEFNDLIDYICSLLRLHLEVARLSKPVAFHETTWTEEIVRCHQRFCGTHLKNNETSSFLAASFGKFKVEKYMHEFMFDAL